MSEEMYALKLDGKRVLNARRRGVKIPCSVLSF
jgi:hypothetical protein